LHCDHDSFRLKLPAQPNKRLEHVWPRRGIGTSMTPEAGEKLYPVARYRPVVAIQPTTQPCLHVLVALNKQTAGPDRRLDQ
jgi:hypothetical protein